MIKTRIEYFIEYWLLCFVFSSKDFILHTHEFNIKELFKIGTDISNFFKIEILENAKFKTMKMMMLRASA